MPTIQELLGTPLSEMSDEELQAFVRSSRASRTTIIHENETAPARKSKKADKIPDDLLDLMGDL